MLQVGGSIASIRASVWWLGKVVGNSKCRSMFDDVVFIAIRPSHAPLSRAKKFDDVSFILSMPWLVLI